MKRYDQGSVGMRPDPEGSWCDYAEARAEIERLCGLLRNALPDNENLDTDWHMRVREVLDRATIDHHFAWMGNSETWKREHGIVYGMWAEIERLREAEKQWAQHFVDQELEATQQAQEIERLRAALVADDGGSTAYQSGWHARDTEIELLRMQSCQCGEDEACKFVQEIGELRKELSTAKSQLYNYNISIREALRRVDGFEWIVEETDDA